LAEHNQFLPIEAPCAASTTIGGLLARNAAGPLRHFYGGLRDYCIGIQFVTGDGKLAKAGGRVVKNVAGFDLMKLLIGSYGSLAVLTGANFKVFPRPDRHGELRSFILEFGSLREAIECRDRITRSPLSPLSLEITSPSAHEYLQSTPEPRDADHYSPEHPIHTAAGNWKILFRAAGSENIVARYRRELTDARELSGEGERQLWQHVVNFSNSVLTRHQNAMLLHIELVPSVAAHALAIAQQVATDNNFVMAAVGRAAVTSLTCAFLPLSVDPPSAMQYALAVSAIRAALPLDACIIATRVPTEAKRHFSIWGSSPTDFGSMLAIKRALDPQNILNRGRFLV
jgi:glycolate oxidase FAD binding subunit